MSWLTSFPIATATPTPTAIPTQTPTTMPTGWLGPLNLHGHVTEIGSGIPIQGAVISGEVRGNTIRPLPLATTQADGSYELDRGSGVYDTDLLALNVSASGYENAHVERSAIAVYQGNAIDIALRSIAATVTPSPTKPAFLHVTVDLQGRPPAPNIAWQTPLTVTLSAGGLNCLVRYRDIGQCGGIRIGAARGAELYRPGQGAEYAIEYHPNVGA